MQCGIDPKGSFISSCSFMSHRLWLPLFLQVSTSIPIPITQVCLKLNCKLNWNFICGPLYFSPVTVVQVIDFSFCNSSLSNASAHLLLGITAIRVVLGVMLLILAVISNLKQSVALYKATKQWQPNHYMQLFMKDGILYFVAYVPLFLSSSSIHYHHTLPSILFPSTCKNN
jgi:hypothetical protein